MELGDTEDLMVVEGHAGRLTTATEVLGGKEYATALRQELANIRQELMRNPDLVKGVGLK